jgi:hypothetical protein
VAGQGAEDDGDQGDGEWIADQVLSAAIPVMVRVSTVVVRSGTAIVRAAAFWIPIATQPHDKRYRKPATGGLPLYAAGMTEAAGNSAWMVSAT